MIRFFLLFFATIVFVQAKAQQEPAVQDSVPKLLNEVILTALRSKQENLRTPYSVNAVNTQELNKYNPRSTPEALQGLTGVFVQKTNHGGGSAFVRGLTGNQALLLLDGVRLNNSTYRYGPNQYLNTVDMYSIGRIEVVKGTGSVQYGSDAMGGVVQLFTREPEFSTTANKWGGRLTGKLMSGGMEATGRADVSVSGKNTALIGGISKKHFGDLIGGDTTGKQSPSGYDEWGMDINLKVRLRSNSTLQLVSQFLQQQQVPVYHKVVLENFKLNEMDPQQRFFSYLRLKTEHSSKFFRESEFTLSLQDGIEGRNNQKNGSTVLRKERDRIRTAGFSADIRSVFTKHWSASSGAEIYLDKVFSTRSDINTSSGVSDQKRGLYPDGSTYGNYSLYSLHHINLGRIFIDAGLRYNSFNITISDTSLGKVHVTPSALVQNAAILYSISKSTAVYFSYSSGFRAPNVDDMGTLGIVDFRYEVPASGLKPERTAQSELGYKWQGKKFSATAAVFYMDITNLITRVREAGQVISGYPVYRKENTDAAFIRGAEFSIAAQLTKALDLKGGLSYTYGQSLTRNEPMRRIPPFNGRWLLTYQKGQHWFASAEWLFAVAQHRLAQGDKEDNRIPAGGTPGWKVFNLYGGYQVKHVSFSAGFQNLLNEDYRTHGSGINGVGRSAWISVSWHL